MKSRAGRPAIPMELRELIRRKARQNLYREPAEFTELFVGMEGQYQDAAGAALKRNGHQPAHPAPLHLGGGSLDRWSATASKSAGA